MACKQCEILFAPRFAKQIYCSMACYSDFRKSAHPYNWKGGRHIFRECLFCGMKFAADKYDVLKGRGRFCTMRCFAEHLKAKGLRRGERASNWQGGISIAARTCKKCGKEFRIKTKELRRGQAGSFCSQRCYLLSFTDQRFPKENKYRCGKRKDLADIFFRSSWEANWARYLNWLVTNGRITSWSYEPDTFEFSNLERGVRTYTPDFKVTLPDGAIEYHEVKGYMDERSALKLKLMAKHFPSVNIMLVTNSTYSLIRKQVSGQIENWEL